jgi:hypothetical protein
MESIVLLLLWLLYKRDWVYDYACIDLEVIAYRKKPI